MAYEGRRTRRPSAVGTRTSRRHIPGTERARPGRSADVNVALASSERSLRGWRSVSAPRLELHERHSTRSGPSGWPPRASGVTWSAVRSLVAPQFEHHGCAAITATGWTKKIARKPASTCAGRRLAAKSPICVMADSALGRTVDCGARCRAIRARPGPPPHPAAAGGGLGIGLPHRDSQPPSLARRGAAQVGAYVVLDSTTQALRRRSR